MIQMAHMAPRKAHKKTRSGCLQCKRRKVKCGEEDCPCNNCVKRGLECKYAPTVPTSVTSDGNTNSPSPYPRQSSNSTRADCTEAQHQHAGLTRQEELCLVHYYITSEGMGMSRHTGDAEIWKNSPFHDGLKYEFVLDAVLALAALHKAHLDPPNSEKYTSACLHYQSQCLRAYQQELVDINQDNCHALFAVSALIHVITTAMSGGGPSLLQTPPLETLFTTIKLLRGIQVVLHTTYETVKSQHWKDVFAASKVPEGSDCSPEANDALEELRRNVVQLGKTSESPHIDIYNETIDSLQRHFVQVEHENFGAIISWLLVINKKAEELLKERDPMMMLIFIHYGVLYLRIHERWWAHNYGCRLIWELSESLHALGASWLPLTSWARSKATSVQGVPASQSIF